MQSRGNSPEPREKSFRQVPLFRDLDDTVLSELCTLFVIERFPADTRLFRAGDAGSYMFLVESGRVQIKLSDTEGDEVVLADLRSGEFFGELVLLDDKPRSADAVVVEDATLAILSRSTFHSLIDRRPGIVLPLLSAMAHRLRRTDELLRHRVARNANEEEAAGATLADRAADLIASFGGSWKFMIAAICFLAAWVIGNSWLLFEKVFDPFPYIFLNLVLNMVTALQAPIIMMSQNRQAKKDRIRADLDYRVNLNNELMLSEITRRLDALEQHSMKS
jgi:CRP/FNR family transcriptional regulator, cyclic AMP receptor protein